MKKVNVHEAKSQLSKLIQLAKTGEEVIIANNGKDEVRLVAIQPDTKDWWGMDEGKGWIADKFDELDDDLMRAFYGEDDNDTDPLRHSRFFMDIPRAKKGTTKR
jgi:prevent-host-death family protein